MTIRFYYQWFKLGHAYWKARHVLVLKAWLDSLDIPSGSVGDQMEAWLADQDSEPTS